jgi:hypothetical protein
MVQPCEKFMPLIDPKSAEKNVLHPPHSSGKLAREKHLNGAFTVVFIINCSRFFSSRV